MKNKSKNEDSKKINRQLISILVFFLMLVVISLSLMLVRCDNSTPISLIKPFYTITYVDGNGTVLETDKTLEGEIPQYDGPLLSNPICDTNWIYEFDSKTSWKNAASGKKGLKPVTADTTYKVSFNMMVQNVRYVYDEATNSYIATQVKTDKRNDHIIISDKYNDEFDPNTNIHHGILPVTRIEEFAFRNTSWGQRVETVTIPDTVRSIGKNAFYLCTKLKEVILSVSTSQLTTIGSQAFYDASSLTQFPFPASLEVIGQSAFHNTALTSVSFPENSKLTNITNAFNSIQTLVEVMLPEGVKAFKQLMLFYCQALQFVSFSDSITEIGMGAFSYTAITGDLYIPASVTTVGAYIVFDCKNLKQIRCGAPDPGAGKRPEGWDELWNYRCNAEIVWGAES